MDKSDHSLIGTLSKLHGVKGAYQLFADRPINEDIENQESVFLEIQGLLIPFFIESIRLTSENSAIIKLEDIDNPETAKEFISCNVFETSKKSPKAPKKEAAEDFHGFAVIDKTRGAIGHVVEVLNYNENILLSIIHNNREILIPVSEEIVLSINSKKKEILVDAPEGLIDLN
jgi:16S rRNA processing protein RimM